MKKSGKSSKHDEESSSKGHSGLAHVQTNNAEGNGKTHAEYEHGSHSDHHSTGGGSHHTNEAREGEKVKKAQSTKVYY